MPIEITMPRLSDTMESGTILKWNVSEGDEVTSGSVVADVETDKATMELSVFDAGRIAKILVGEGETVDIGTPIALLAGEDEDVATVAKGAGGAGAAGGATARKPAPEAAPARAGMSARTEPADASLAGAESAPEAHDNEEDDDGDHGATGGAAPAESRAPDDGGRKRISPVARRLAADHGIDVGSLAGTGPGGRVIKRDVMKAVEATAETAAAIAPSAARSAASGARSATASAAPGARASTGAAGASALSASIEGGTARLARAGGASVRDLAQFPSSAGAAELPVLADRRIPLSNMRQTIARRLVESSSTIPHYQVSMTFDMDPLLSLRKSLNEQLESFGVKLSVNDFLVRGCALAMHRHPEINSSWDGDAIMVHGEVNVGMAISVGPERGGGLVVGVIRDADQKSLRAIAAESRRLAEKARSRGLTVEEMSGSTFTLSNLGMFGVDHFTAIINPPNSAILAVGAAVEKPVVRAGALTIGNEMTVTLSSDHRVIDGAMAAEFLQTLQGLIEHPATLLV